MTDPESEALLRYGEIIRQLLKETDAVNEPQKGERTLTAKRELGDLLIELRLGVAREDRTIERLSTVRAEMRSSDSERAVETLEAVRLRMVGSLLAESSEKLLATLTGESDFENGTAVTTPSGLTYSKVAGRCVVLLPTFELEEQVNRFGSDMIDVYDCALGTSGLVFDCSAVKRFPYVLQGLILGYKHSFALLNKSFSVVWLHKEALPTGAQVQEAQAFAAGELGPFLFSLQR